LSALNTTTSLIGMT